MRCLKCDKICTKNGTTRFQFVCAKCALEEIDREIEVLNNIKRLIK